MELNSEYNAMKLKMILIRWTAKNCKNGNWKNFNFRSNF